MEKSNKKCSIIKFTFLICAVAKLAVAENFHIAKLFVSQNPVIVL